MKQRENTVTIFNKTYNKNNKRHPQLNSSHHENRVGFTSSIPIKFIRKNKQYLLTHWIEWILQYVNHLAEKPQIQEWLMAYDHIIHPKSNQNPQTRL